MEDVILIPSAILGEGLNHTQIILLGVIMKLSIKNKKNDPSNEELGKMIHVDVRTIQRCLKKLVELNHVRVERQNCHGGVTKMSPQNVQVGTNEGQKKRTLTTKMSPLYNIYYSLYNQTSSKKEEKNIRKEEMLDAFRKDERLTRYQNEEDVIRWWEHKQASKKPYKDVNSFMRAMVTIKNIIKYYGDTLKSDRDIRNRFNYAVTEAIEKGWEGLNWYDSMEQAYESSKDDLYPNPKQNE